MTRRDLVGVRDEDLHATERADLAQLLGEDPTAREEHDFAMHLHELLGEDEAGGPTLAEVRARSGASSSRWLWGAGVALAAAAMLWVGIPTDDGVRDRGGAGQLEVALSAVAEGPAGVRPLRSGDRVGPEEQVGPVHQGDDYARLCFTFADEQQIDEGCRRLGRVLATLGSEKQP